MPSASTKTATSKDSTDSVVGASAKSGDVTVSLVEGSEGRIAQAQSRGTEVSDPSSSGTVQPMDVPSTVAVGDWKEVQTTNFHTAKMEKDSQTMSMFDASMRRGVPDSTDNVSSSSLSVGQVCSSDRKEANKRQQGGRLTTVGKVKKTVWIFWRWGQVMARVVGLHAIAVGLEWRASVKQAIASFSGRISF